MLSYLRFILMIFFVVLSSNPSWAGSNVVEAIRGDGPLMIDTPKGFVARTLSGKWRFVPDNNKSPLMQPDSQTIEELTTLCASLVEGFKVDNTDKDSPVEEQVVITVGYKQQVAYIFNLSQQDRPKELIQLIELVDRKVKGYTSNTSGPTK